MDTPLLIALVAVGVAGLAAVIAIWMERDPRRPPRWAWSLSMLIMMATGVSMFQSYVDSKEAEKTQEDMARMLQQLDRLAASGDNPELAAFVSDELSAQARANPEMIEMVAQRVADEGGDPAEMLSKHMKASDVEGIAREGKLKTKPKATSVKTAEPAKKEPVKIEVETGDESGSGDGPKVERKGAIIIGGGADAGPGGGPGLLLGGGGRGEDGEPAAEGAKVPRGGGLILGGSGDKAAEPAPQPRPAGGLTVPGGATKKSGAAKTSGTGKTGGIGKVGGR